MLRHTGDQRLSSSDDAFAAFNAIIRHHIASSTSALEFDASTSGVVQVVVCPGAASSCFALASLPAQVVCAMGYCWSQNLQE